MKNGNFFERLFLKIEFFRVFIGLSFDYVKDSFRIRCSEFVRWVRFGYALIKAPDRKSRQMIIDKERSYQRRLKRIERYNNLSYAGLTDMMYAIVAWYEYPDSCYITKEEHDNAKANFAHAKNRLLLYSRWHDTLSLDVRDYILQEKQADRLEAAQLEDFGSTGEWIDFLTEIFDSEIIDFRP